MKLAIGIATAGRAEQLHATLAQVARQVSLPHATFICPAKREDFDSSMRYGLLMPIRVEAPARGLCAQRNAIIEAAGDIDVLVFLDDDYYPAPDYIRHVKWLFENDPSIVVATSYPKVDGAVGPGIRHQDALAEVARMTSVPCAAAIVTDTYSGYGCNMAINLNAVRRSGIRFDEALPLYAWLEDVDFTRRLAPYGRIVISSGLQGVHLGIKRARSPGRQLGYSQIANPLYIAGKGSITSTYALRQLIRNVAKNIAMSPWPETWVDRRGRLRGNLAALADFVTGKLHPQNIDKLQLK